MRLADLWFLAPLCGVLISCEVTRPVRVVTPTKGVFQEIRDAVGTEAFFRERDGLTFAGTRTYPNADGAESVERPVSLSLRPNGAFLLTVGTADAAAATGFDGREAWTLNPRGIASSVGLGAMQHQLADGWLRTLLWLTPGDERFSITPVDPAPGAVAIELTLKRIGEPVEATLFVDASSKRPLAYSIAKNGRVRSIAFSDWRLTEGVWFPHAMTETLDDATVHVDRFERRTRGTPRSLGKPRSRPTDVEFQSSPLTGSGVGSLTARVDQGGRFYVRGTVGSLEDAWMLLDTGFGSHAIHMELVESVGVRLGGSAQLQGVSGAGSGAWVQAEQLALGHFQQISPRFITVDTTFLSERAGFPVAGILGAPLFHRAVVTLDEPRARVLLHDPRSFERRGLSWFPVVLDGTSPCLGGRILANGRPTERLYFRLDTGSDDTVTVSEWAARRFRLVGDRANLRATRIEGAFGTVLGWRKALDGVSLGPVSEVNAGTGSPASERSMATTPGLRLLAPQATLLRDANLGPLSDPWVAGNLGTRALRGCRVVLDLSAARISIQSDGTK